MAVGRKASWTLEDLVDFEVAVVRSPVVESKVGQEIREKLRGRDASNLEARRWGLKQWLESKPRGSGARVISAARLLGLILLVITFLFGVALIRGLVVRIDGQAALNIWVLLAGTLGVQWLILITGVVGYLVARYWIGGLGWLKEAAGAILRRLAGKVSPEAWKALVTGKGKQPSALAWRLTRLLQLGGVGFNLGLMAGLFGVLWFTEVAFFWESSLSQFGGESLGRVTRVLALVWGGSGLNPEQIAGLRDLSAQAGDDDWRAFFYFVFAALFFWGLVPRLALWAAAFWQERRTLAGLEFQDLEHRKLWRSISRVERTVSMEGMKDGVVLLDVGGLGFSTELIRPFLLRKLRVNPEKCYGVGVLDEKVEQDAWEAIRRAPLGVVLLVEDWSLSPKEMTSLFDRIRREAGEETVMRVLVFGDGVVEPDAGEFAAWLKFVDGLRNERLECVAYKDE